MDIYVNIWRAITRITELRNKKMHTYCLFLDFSSAYNTVPHNLLYDKLKSILNAKEIQLIQAIYSRTTICLGKDSFQPNIGVAQGSVISPVLFNIYAESLLKDLQEKGWGINDLLGFADDHLVINITKSQLRSAIVFTKEWCNAINIKLNPDKCGILEIPSKYHHHTLEIGSKLEGIPIVEEYKYLGLILDNQMNGNKHLNKLFGWKDQAGKKHNGKIKFLKNNLSPLIKNISLDYRINLWQVLIRPLFIPLALLSNFLCQTSKEQMARKLKKTIKWFLGLNKNTPDEIVFHLVDVDLEKWAEVERTRAKKKWEARVNFQDVGTLPKYLINVNNKWLPKEIAEFINLQCAFCKECNTILTAYHYQKHNVPVLSLFELLEECNRNIEETQNSLKRTLKRNEVLAINKTMISQYINEMKSFLNR